MIFNQMKWNNHTVLSAHLYGKLLYKMGQAFLDRQYYLTSYHGQPSGRIQGGGKEGVAKIPVFPPPTST